MSSVEEEASEAAAADPVAESSSAADGTTRGGGTGGGDDAGIGGGADAAGDRKDDYDDDATATVASSAASRATGQNPAPPSPPLADPSQHEDDEEEDDSNDSILCLSFNQDGGCLAVGTTRGFRICNVHPFQETFRRTFSPTRGTGSGVGLVEMLFRCNLLLLSGGSAPSPLYPPNKLYVWDDHRSKPIGELSFRQRVLSTKLRRDRIAVCLIDRVYVYNFSDLRLIDTVHTSRNPHGLMALSPDPTPGRTALACPGLTRGHVRVELYELRKTTLIEAHEGELAALALSIDGSRLCTASERGTIVRVFDTRTGGSPLRELRRGVERARISCLCFSLDRSWLAAGSDRGTVHVFRLEEGAGEDGGGGERGSGGAGAGGGEAHRNGHGHGHGHHHGDSSSAHSGGGLVKSLVPKFARPFTIGDGEQSYAQIRGIEDPAVCAFVPDANRTIAVVGRDGSLLISDFSGGGEGERVAYHRFFRKRGSSGAAGVGSVGLRPEGGRGGVGSSNGGDFVSKEMDGVVFGDEEQEDGFIAVDNQSKIGKEAAANRRSADL